MNKESKIRKFLRIIAVVGTIFGTMFGLPNNAYATCVNYIQSQTIAAAYEGDVTPVVNTMDTCGGDDTSYQIPIATTITFDGVEYSNVYATTNSVITFGNPDNTYWDYPNTPSISLYSMDWVSGWYNAPDTLNIYYSEGGFQLDLEVIPFGQWATPTPSNINILVAITNTGNISVSYSYQGPEYPNLRTGVRLHSGQVISLEEWGATQVQPGEEIPSLDADPISEEPVLTPEQQQAQIVEATQLASDIADLNNLIANINGEEAPVTPEPEPTEEPDLPDPDVEVDPEIIDENDPRFPDDDEQSQPGEATPSPDSDATDGESEDPNLEPEQPEEPSEEPQPQPEDTDQGQGNEPTPNLPDLPDSSDNDSTAISEEELKKLNKLISENDAKLLAQLVGTNETIKQAVEEFKDREAANADAPMPYTIADATVEVQAEKFLENPIGAVLNVDLETVLSPSEWGKDMTDDQREKAQEVIIPVILVSNIVNSVMSLRRL